jgi:hypothetical protein
VTPAELQARWWLWLVPAWLRATRGEEIVATVLDSLPPGTTRLPWRSRLDLLRAGLAARRRGTPRLGVWLTIANARRGSRAGCIDPYWRPWLATRLPHRTFTWCCAPVRILPLMAPTIILSSMGPNFDLSSVWVIYLVISIGGVVMVAALQGASWRDDLAAKNAIDLAVGQPIAEVRWAEYPARCRNVTLVPAAATLAFVTGPMAALVARLTAPYTSRSGRPMLVAALLVTAALPTVVLTVRTRRPRWPHAVAVPWPHPVFILGTSMGAAGAIFGWVCEIFAVAPEVVGATISLAGLGLLVTALAVGRRRGAAVGVWEVVRSLGPVPTLVRAAQA